MKCTLTKASDFMNNPKEIEISNLDDLLSLIDETEGGSVVVNRKKPDEWDPETRKFIYKPLDVTEIIIYDDYLE